MNVTTLHTGVLAGAKAPHGSLFKGNSAPAGSTDWFALAGIDFSALFAAQVAPQAAGAPAPLTDASSATVKDPQQLLTRLIQRGTPLSTIGTSIAQRVGDSVKKLLAGKLPQNDLDRLSSKLAHAVSNALAPPGTAPPGTAAQQAAALAQRLTDLVNALARDGGNGAGQQNEISGTLLDAITAKEPPAQQKTIGTPSTTLDVAKLVRSLLAAAVPSLQTQSTQAPPSPARPSSNASQPRISAESAAPAITIANAPDLLARMLVRAAGADRNVNAHASASLAAAPAIPASDRGAPAPSLVAARLAASLTSIVANASGADAGGNGGSSGGAFAHDRNEPSFAPSSQTARTDATPATFAAAMPTAHLQTLVQQLHETQSAQARTDANAVIAQLVKGMVMRTNAQGNSEIRLRLQPENLGDVTMKITVQGSQISANVVAQNADVKSALMNNQHHLARALAESGLTLAGFSVDVSGGDAGRDQSRERTGGFGRRYVVHELHGATESAQPDLAAGPPLVSGSGLELFNYLA